MAIADGGGGGGNQGSGTNGGGGGGGSVTMAGSGTNYITGLNPSGDRLINVDNTIRSAGTIGLSTLSLVNQAAGLIEATSGNTLFVNATAGVTNQGVMQADSGGQLMLQNGTIDNTGGTIQAFAGGYISLSTSVARLSGSLITISGRTVSADVLDAGADAGTVGSILVDGIGSQVSTTGQMTLADAGTATLTIRNSGTVTVVGALDTGVQAGSDAVIDISGTGSDLQVTGALNVGVAALGSLSVVSGGTVTASTLDAGVLGNGSGIVSVAGGSTSLNITGGSTVGQGGSGTLNVANGGAVTLAVDLQGGSGLGLRMHDAGEEGEDSGRLGFAAGATPSGQPILYCLTGPGGTPARWLWRNCHRRHAGLVPRPHHDPDAMGWRRSWCTGGAIAFATWPPSGLDARYPYKGKASCPKDETNIPPRPLYGGRSEATYCLFFFGQVHSEPNEVESWPLTPLHEKVFKIG